MLRRLLLTQNVEFYECRRSLYSDVMFYLLFLDYRRQSRYDDFSHIPGYEEEDFVPRGNFIKAIVLFDSELADETKEEAYEIASGFLEDKDNCDWAMDYCHYSFEDIQEVATNPTIIPSVLNSIFKRIHYNSDIMIMDMNSFNHLMQN